MSVNTRRVTKFFKIGLTSIQGRFTLGYLITVLAGSASIITTYYLWVNINNDKEVIIHHYKPISFEASRLQNLIQQSQANLHKFLYLREEGVEKSSKELWLLQIKDQKETLGNLIYYSQDKDFKDQYAIIVNYMAELEQTQQKEVLNKLKTTLNEAIIKHNVKTSVLQAFNGVEKEINKLISLVREKENRLTEKIQESEYLLNRIVILLGLAVFAFCYLIILFLLRGIYRWTTEIHTKIKTLSSGNLTEPLILENNEFKIISRNINQLNENLKAVSDYAIKVGLGNFTEETKIFDQDSTLGKSLNEMRLSLQKVYEEEKKRNWTTEGLAKFSEILRSNSQDIDQICHETINNIVRYLNINHGCIFILQEEDYQKPYFELKAAYAFGREKFLNKKVDAKEGLLGRIYFEKETVLINNIPDDYLKITSGLGSTTSKSLILLPLKTDENEIKGALELASLNEFEDYQIDVLEKLCNSITSTLMVVITTQKNQILLDESQKITSSLRLKEVETRTSAEDLNRIQEQFSGKMQKLEDELAKISALFDNIAEAVLLVNDKYQIEYANQKASLLLAYLKTDLIGKNLSELTNTGFTLIEETVGDNENAAPYPIIRKGVKTLKQDGAFTNIDIKLHELVIKDQLYYYLILE